MKKTLLIVLLLVPFFGFSQTTKPIESFLSIKFGSSKAEVIAAMKAKGYNLLKSDENSDTNLEFGAVNYAHRQTQAFAVEFVDNKCYEAIFDFPISSFQLNHPKTFPATSKCFLHLPHP